MKLNRKGYMLVEIIVASVLAMGIAYYLLDLTYKFKDTNSDIYQSYYYTKDKLLITKNIMSDIEKGTILEIYMSESNNDTQKIEFNFNINGVTEKRQIEVTESGNNKIIKYGKIDGSKNYIINDISYYEKTLEKSLVVGKLEYNEKNDATFILIPIKSIYDNKDYSVKLIGHKKYRVDINLKSTKLTNPTETDWVLHPYGYMKNHGKAYGETSNTNGQDIVFTLEANGTTISSKKNDECTYLLYETELVITELLYKNASGAMVPVSNYNDGNKIKIKLKDDTNINIHINDTDPNNIKYIEKKENEGLIIELK